MKPYFTTLYHCISLTVIPILSRFAEFCEFGIKFQFQKGAALHDSASFEPVSIPQSGLTCTQASEIYKEMKPHNFLFH